MIIQKAGTCPDKNSNEYKRIMGGVLQFSYGQTMDDGRICLNTQCTQSTSGTGVKKYLESLFGTYLVKGTTSAPGSCAGWGTIKYKEHPNTKVGSSKSSYMHGQDGDDVLHYDALKTWGENALLMPREPKAAKADGIRIQVLLYMVQMELILAVH